MNLRAAILLSLFSVPGALAQTPSFTLIDPPPGLPLSSAVGISADGTVVAGYGRNTNLTGYASFRWTSASRQDFGSGVSPANQPTGISGDGQVVVGQTLGSQPPGLFRWSVSG